ncbi:unnamed protein product [Eruca vesicaria subsp. sativa]|uniref:Transmembrane protein n=1 Tax=Eruca vesicaria subsp. sativa TaxID=29727 RepID=A0ABC8K173_ERUVS|nr:unnamed protein product [Eruca vesicaria subsp. sativa]
MFEILERPIDFGSPDLGPRSFGSFDVVLLRCFDEVLGDGEETSLGLALVRSGGRRLSFLCLGVSVKEWPSSALKDGHWSSFLMSTRWFSDLLFVLCLPLPSVLLVVNSVSSFALSWWAVSSYHVLLWRVVFVYLRQSSLRSSVLPSFTEMAYLGVPPSQWHGGQLDCSVRRSPFLFSTQYLFPSTFVKTASFAARFYVLSGQ